MTLYAADSNEGQVAILEEAFYGTTPSPFDATKIPVTSSTLNVNKNTVRSNLIRSDGMPGPTVKTSSSTSGDFPTELILGGTFDQIFQAVARGIWSSGGSEIIRFRGDVVFTNATSNVQAVGAFASAVVGARFHASECTNAGDYTIVTVTDDDNVVVSETVADETTTSGEVMLVGYEPMAIDATGALAIVAATRTFTLLGAFANAQPEQAFYVSGMVNAVNNGWHIIETVTDNDNVVVYTPAAELTDETGPGTATMKGVGVRNGTVKRSFSDEIYMSDRDIHFLYAGQRFGNMSLEVSASDIVTLSFATRGGTATVGTGETTGTKVDYPALESVNATANVAKLRIDNTAVSCSVQSLSFNVDDSLRDQMATGSEYACNIGYGRQMVTGNLVTYLKDLTQYNLMLNHTDFALEFAFEDADGNCMHVYVPTIRLLTDTGSQLPGVDTDIEESMDWAAEPHAEGFQMQITMYTP